MNRRKFLGSLLGGIAGLLVPLPKPTPKAYNISRSTGVIIPSTSLVKIPYFEVASNPIINISEIKARRFYIVDRAQQKARAAIQQEEDCSIFRALRRVA